MTFQKKITFYNRNTTHNGSATSLTLGVFVIVRLQTWDNNMQLMELLWDQS